MPFETPRGYTQLPDTNRYRNRFEVESDSSDKKYTVAFDIAKNAGYWTCSCMGCCTRGQCKHLTRFGLNGRNAGSSHPANMEMIRSLVTNHPALYKTPVQEQYPVAPTTYAKKAKVEEAVPIWTEADISQAAAGFA